MRYRLLGLLCVLATSAPLECGCVRTVGYRLSGDGSAAKDAGGDAVASGTDGKAPSDGVIEPNEASAPCPSPCTTCAAGLCTIVCDNPLCPAHTCPPGWQCLFQCTTDASCNEAIDCGSSRNCKVECSGTGACAGPITCGAGDCIVRCSGYGSCTTTIGAGSATDGMEIHCIGPSSCAAEMKCGKGRCDVECSGLTSCAGSLYCQESCNCTQQCGGFVSCGGIVTCPPSCPSCRDGAACGTCP